MTIQSTNYGCGSASKPAFSGSDSKKNKSPKTPDFNEALFSGKDTVSFSNKKNTEGKKEDCCPC